MVCRELLLFLAGFASLSLGLVRIQTTDNSHGVRQAEVGSDATFVCESVGQQVQWKHKSESVITLNTSQPNN